MNDSGSLARVRIVLSHTSHPGNIGAAARAMKTMGLSKLVLVKPKEFPAAQADAMAAGAVDVLADARVCETLPEALAGTTFAVAMTARRRSLATEPMWARAAAGELAGRAARGEVALVFGNETAGLSNEDLALCAHWAQIPTDAVFSSLNVAQAVQVMCYELRLAVLGAGPPPAVTDAGVPAGFDEVEGLINHLERAAVASGFLDPASPKRLIPRMRRLFARAAIEREEVNILRGMLSAFETGPYRKRD